MCGIVATFNYAQKSKPFSAEEIARARDSMQYRGPDAAGLWEGGDGRVILGHRRLAIIDLDPSANQPMFLAGTGLRIVTNGEVFNYRELREELRALGAVFATASDTEVILHAYRHWGLDGLQRLRGMFAFALWDDRAETLLLVRDPLGIKPLFFYDDGRQVLAASQVRAIASIAGSLAPDPVGHCGFFVNGYVPEPHTMFRDIQAVPAGGYRLYGRGSVKNGQYFSLSKLAAGAAEQVVAPQDRRDAIAAAIGSSVACHLVSDVRVGIFLSAGVDSTLLAWAAKSAGASAPDGLTLGADQYRNTDCDEVPLATAFADKIGISHHAKYVGGSNFLSMIDELSERMDQPSIDGVNTYLVSRMAQDFGYKVVLSGLGGDELFAGYPGYRQIPELVNAVRMLGPVAGAGKLLRRLGAGLVGQFTSPKYASLIELGGSFSDAYLLRRALYLPWEIRQTDGALFADEVCQAAAYHGVGEVELNAIPSPQGRVALLEMTRYMKNQLLRDSDWAGMASSIEIRVPLVDSVLIGELAPLIFGPQPMTKLEAVEALRHPMGREIAAHPKRGFGLPVREWMAQGHVTSRRGLRDWADHIYLRWCRDVGTEPLVRTRGALR